MSEVRKNKDKFNIRLEDGLRDLAYKKSAESGVSMNTLLNRCIDKGLSGPIGDLFNGVSDTEPAGEGEQLNWVPAVGALVEYVCLGITVRGIITAFTVDINGDILAYVDDINPGGQRGVIVTLRRLKPLVVTYNGN